MPSIEVLEKHYGNVTPCEDEKELEIHGQIPSWLCGNLLRLGPGLFDLDENFCVNHWFDGAAILYKISIEPGKACFKSKFLNTETYKKMITVKRPVFTEFGTPSYPDPTKSIFTRFLNKFVPSNMSDNVHGNIYKIGDEYFCASETCILWKINPNTLDCVARVDISKVSRISLFTSHPIEDQDGTVYNIGISFITGLKYHILKIPGNSEKKPETSRLNLVTDLARISPTWKTMFSYIHSFGLTTNYIILIEQPMLINSLKLISITAKQQALKESFEWHGEKEKIRIHIIKKSTGEVLKTRYVSAAFFFIHFSNAYEDDEHIVFDLVSYENSQLFENFYLKNLRKEVNNDNQSAKPSLKRFVIPLVDPKTVTIESNLNKLDYTTSTAIKTDDNTIFITPECLLDLAFEIPNINRKFLSKNYRYIYGNGSLCKDEFVNSLIKFDVSSKSKTFWRGNEHEFAGEPLFVPKPGSTEEDQGVILAVVSNLETVEIKTCVLVLDAASFTELARINCIWQVSPTVHGMFVFYDEKEKNGKAIQPEAST